MNLELGWRPESSKDLLVSSPNNADIIGDGNQAWLFHRSSLQLLMFAQPTILHTVSSL